MSNRTNKQRVLLVCYYFPPLGGAGIMRPLALYRHLPEIGIECDILTVKPVTYRVYEPELLDSLETEHIYRSGSFDPQRMLYVLGIRKLKESTIEHSRVLSDKYFPDPKVGWVRSAVKLGRTLISNRQYNSVISTSPPLSAHLVAMQLCREAKLPWIADFRDYWTSHTIEETYHDKHNIEKGHALLDKISTEATILTAVNKSVSDYVGGDKVIHNCFDLFLQKQWRIPEKQSMFTIGLLGTYSDRLPLIPLFELLVMLKEDHPDLYDAISITQVGSVNEQWLLALLRKYNLIEKCEMHGFRSREESIELLNSTSMMYLSIASDKEKGLSTGRIYSMISSGRPILAAVPPDSEIDKLIQQTGNGFRFDSESTAHALSYLVEHITTHQKGNTSVLYMPTYADVFSSKAMTNEFAELIRRV